MESNEGRNKGKKAISMDDEEFQDHDHMVINHRHVINSHVASTSTGVVASTSSAAANRVAIAAPTKQTTATISKKSKKPVDTSSRGKGHDVDHLEAERVRFVNGEYENMNHTSDVLCRKGKKVVSMDDEEPQNDHMVINHQQHANSHMASTSNGILATTYLEKAKKTRELCGLCKKNFVSLKYLYFHLRDDHIDEDWKTFFAPPNTQNIDLKECLPTNWSAKQARRGQTRVQRLMDKCTTLSTGCRRMREMTDNEKRAVEALLLLAPGKMILDSELNQIYQGRLIS